MVHPLYGNGGKISVAPPSAGNGSLVPSSDEVEPTITSLGIPAKLSGVVGFAQMAMLDSLKNLAKGSNKPLLIPLPNLRGYDKDEGEFTFSVNLPQDTFASITEHVSDLKKVLGISGYVYNFGEGVLKVRLNEAQLNEIAKPYSKSAVACVSY